MMSYAVEIVTHLYEFSFDFNEITLHTTVV